MIIYYKRYEKEASAGDMKILKSGAIFFRAQQIWNGMYCVSGNRPSYSWYESDDERVEHYLKDFNINQYSIFRSTSKTKVQKTRIVNFDFTQEKDRQRYREFTGIIVEADTTIKSAKLEVGI
jgi:hypothetical protein